MALRGIMAPWVFCWFVCFLKFIFIVGLYISLKKESFGGRGFSNLKDVISFKNLKPCQGSNLLNFCLKRVTGNSQQHKNSKCSWIVTKT